MAEIEEIEELKKLNRIISEANNRIKEILLQGKSPIHPVLFKKIDKLKLNTRTQHCLESENISYIGELVVKSKKDLCAIPQLGPRSFRHINNQLEIINQVYKINLYIGMDIPEWIPEEYQINN